MITRDAQHRYWHVTPGGSEPTLPLIGTTTILKEAGFIDTETLRRGNVARGIAVHRIAELEVQGVLDPSTVDARLRGFHDAVRAFCDHYRPVTRHVERVVGNVSKGIAGTLDWAGVIEPRGGGGRGVLIDWKSYAYTPWHRLQLAGSYRDLLQTETGEPYEPWVVTLQSDGTYVVKVLEPPYHADARTMHAAAMTVAWRQRHAGRSGALYGRRS